jgi:TRAP transporter 4TM/12TM fusion protein
VRKLDKRLEIVVSILASAFALFYLYTSGFGIFSTQTNRGVFILFSFVLCTILYPTYKKSPYNKVFYIFDVIVAVLASCSIIYWMLEYAEYARYRVGLPNQWDTFWGIILIIISLEITRRVMGNVLPILGAIFVAQLFMGPYLPGIFAHRGMSLFRIVEFLFSNTEGIFGSIADVFATFIMPFLIFGSFLQKSGGGDFFMDLAKAAAGRISGGPALIAVIGSAVFGSISGSAVANVVATGTFTIPMMKKVGYKPEFAGAVEAAASTGGQFMPPIMGAAAFVLATFTETPYSAIVIMATVPAILYYLAVLLSVYFRARKNNISGLKAEELPKMKDVIKRGWYFGFILVLAVVLIVSGFSPPRVAFWCTILVIVFGMLDKSNRFTLGGIFSTLEASGKSALTVGATAGTLGLIMGGITLAGLGAKFSYVLVSIAGGNIFLAIVLISFIAIIVGMGLPTTASYIVMSILAAPSLIQLGVPAVQAHMLCFWLSVASNVTPPVCIAAYAAASISGGDPMKTGLHAVKLSLFIFLMPFAFVYSPQIMLMGQLLDIVIVVACFTISAFAISAAIQGWFIKTLSLLDRIIFGIATILLIYPNRIADGLGVLIFIVMVFILNKQSRKTQHLAV